jgi:hypothetical protein
MKQNGKLEVEEFKTRKEVIIMTTWGLFFVGCILFINALLLQNKLEKNGAAILNILIGLLVLTAALVNCILNFHSDPWTIWNSAGSTLFAFTYLFLGITNLKDYGAKAVGWYCLWVSIVAIPFALTNIVVFNDYLFGTIWFVWSYLWFLFFLLLGLEKNVLRLTIWSTHIVAWFTCTVPAYLTLIQYL